MSHKGPYGRTCFLGGAGHWRRWVPGARARKVAQLVRCFLYKNVSVFIFFALELSLKNKNKKQKPQHPSLSSESRLSPLTVPTRPLDSLTHSVEPQASSQALRRCPLPQAEGQFPPLYLFSASFREEEITERFIAASTCKLCQGV